MSEQQNRPVFSSRWAMILTCMGMAVGTGNIWRFPREVAQNGGGSFLIPWLLFLFLWSVPLLMVELSVGQKTRKGPFGAFGEILGKKFAWMGGFISICAMLIMCYYAVVTGWTLRYVIYAVTGELNGLSNEQAVSLFDQFRNTPASLAFHFLAVGLAVFFVAKGAKGIERLNKILIPTLILILFIGAIKSLTLEGSGAGLDYLFSVDWALLGEPSHWIKGLTQSAWSTGAGWGLMLSYAVYAREGDDPVSTPMATGAGNNTIEMLVALMIFPALFAIMGAAAPEFVSGASWKGGIAFQTVPLIFGSMTGGYVLNVLFFFGLASAALTSLVSMVELSTRFFIDFKMSRKRALTVTGVLCALIGAPSALSDKVFDNQDFVWGVGLIISGLFLALLVVKHGGKRFCDEFLNRHSGPIKAGTWFQALVGLILVEGVLLFGWWFKAADTTTQVLCVVQWLLLIGVLIVFGDRLDKRMFPEKR